MSNHECCKTGFAWEGKPSGSESKIANNNTYVTGSSKDAAVLIIHDIFGYKFNNVRVLADTYAKEAGVTVYLPDFFGGESVSPDVFDDEKKREAFDVPAFIGRNNKDIRFPEIKAVAQALKSQYPKVAAIGFCYGGWACFQLGSDPSLIDAISTAHPSLLTKEEIDNVKVPVQILSPEIDPIYTPELKAYSNEKIPTLNIPYEYVYFPGVAHGFAARGDPNNKVQRDAFERAKDVAVTFFKTHLAKN